MVVRVGVRVRLRVRAGLGWGKGDGDGGGDLVRDKADLVGTILNTLELWL